MGHIGSLVIHVHPIAQISLIIARPVLILPCNKTTTSFTFGCIYQRRKGGEAEKKKKGLLWGRGWTLDGGRAWL